MDKYKFTTIIDAKFKVCEIVSEEDLKRHGINDVNNLPDSLLEKIKETAIKGIKDWDSSIEIESIKCDLDIKKIEQSEEGE